MTYPEHDPADPKKCRVVWVISPHADGEYDECWLPGERDEDHDAAFDYASDRLEEAWERAGPNEKPSTVTIGQRWVTEEEWAEMEDGR